MCDALQACLGALAVIRDGQSEGPLMRQLCAGLLQSLEDRGFVLQP